MHAEMLRWCDLMHHLIDFNIVWNKKMVLIHASSMGKGSVVSAELSGDVS